MARINSGKYRHIITFQKMKDVQNSYGETSANVDENWEDTITIRGGIFPLSGREFLTLSDDLKLAEVSHRVVFRYITGIDTTMRIKFGNRIFDISSPPINNYERNEEILLFAKERHPTPTGVV